MEDLKNPISIGQTYTVECRDKNGRIKWVEDIHNLVVNEGLNAILTAFYKGSSYTAAHYVGIKGAGTVAAGDTMASHAGWTEVAAYTEATRPALTMGTPSGGSVSNSASKAEFSINSTATIAGAFVTTNSTKSGSTGVLVGAGDFSSEKSLEADDTLSVTITASLSAS